MKRYALACLFASILSGCYSVAKVPRAVLPSISHDKRQLVCMLDAANKTGDPQFETLVARIPALLTADLAATNCFRIIERDRLESVLREQKLQVTGLVDNNNAQLIGKLFGADAVLFGELASVKQQKSRQSLFFLWTESQRTEITLHARLVDVATGELLADVLEQAYVVERQWVAFWFARAGRSLNSGSALNTAVDVVCKKAAQKIAQNAHPKP
jgi:curli biogenesis system outer membrane secretion channel CsgG